MYRVLLVIPLAGRLVDQMERRDSFLDVKLFIIKASNCNPKYTRLEIGGHSALSSVIITITQIVELAN